MRKKTFVVLVLNLYCIGETRCCIANFGALWRPGDPSHMRQTNKLYRLDILDRLDRLMRQIDELDR